MRTIVLTSAAYRRSALNSRGWRGVCTLAALQAVIALGLGSACAPPGLSLRCRSAADCPSGYVCASDTGFCWLAAADAALADGGVALDGGVGSDRDGGGQDLLAGDAVARDQTTADAELDDVAASDAVALDACDAGSAAPPTAAALELRTAVQQDLAVELQGQDPLGQAISYRLVQAPVKGSVGVEAGDRLNDPHLTYTPNIASRGLDRFVYVVTAGCRDSAPATVWIAIVDGDWWDPRWPQRLLLAFDNRDRGEALIDFPVPLVLRDARVDLAQFAPDVSDLRVVSVTGATLAHEVEAWSPTARGAVWVRLPRLEADSLRNLAWLYYGAASVASVEQPSAVWDDSFVGVWHLAGPASTTVVDSTRHALHATRNDPSLTFRSSGFIGEAITFNGDGEPLELADQELLDLTTGMTLEGLAMPSWVTDTNTHYLIKKDESYHVEISGEGGYPGPGASVCVLGDGTNCSQTLSRHQTELPEIGRWYHVAATFGGGSKILQVYVDGQALAPKIADVSSIVPSVHSLLLGRDFYGRIDELRIASQTRSHVWIEAQATALRDGMVHYGPLPWVSQGQVLGASGSTTLELAAGADLESYSQWIVAVGLVPATAEASISGLDLGWTRVLRQCSATGDRVLELWQAEGYAGGQSVVVTASGTSTRRGVIGLTQVVGAHLPHGPAPVLGVNAAGQGEAATCTGGATYSNALSYQLSSSSRGAQAVVAVLADGPVAQVPQARSLALGDWTESAGQPALQLWLHDVTLPMGQEVAVTGTAGSTGTWVVGAAVLRP